jgi:hypothetical protein
MSKEYINPNESKVIINRINFLNYKIELIDSIVYPNLTELETVYPGFDVEYNKIAFLEESLMDFKSLILKPNFQYNFYLYKFKLDLCDINLRLEKFIELIEMSNKSLILKNIGVKTELQAQLESIRSGEKYLNAFTVVTLQSNFKGKRYIDAMLLNKFDCTMV